MTEEDSLKLQIKELEAVIADLKLELRRVCSHKNTRSFFPYRPDDINKQCLDCGKGW